MRPLQRRTNQKKTFCVLPSSILRVDSQEPAVGNAYVNRPSLRCTLHHSSLGFLLALSEVDGHDFVIKALVSRLQLVEQNRNTDSIRRASMDRAELPSGAFDSITGKVSLYTCSNTLECPRKCRRVHAVTV